MIAMEASCLMSARSFSRSALGVPQDWLRSMLQRPATHMYPSQQKCATDLLQRCRTPLRSLCQSKRQEFEQLRSSSGERSLERRDSAQSFLALQGSKYQAAFGTTIKSPARRRSSKVGSGRYAASVIRTSSGRKRIRRAKDGDGEEDDDDAEEPYTSLEDAPIYSSVHGDSFDYDDPGEVPSSLVEDASTEQRIEGANPEQEGPQGDGARASTLENGRTSQNGAASSELDTEQKGLLRSVTVSTALPKEKVKKKAKSSKKVLGKKSKKSTSLGSDNGFGGSLVEVSSQKKGKKALDKAGDGAEMESGGSKETMSRKAADKPAKETKSAAPKLTRSKAFNGRAPEGKVAANENVPEGEVAVNGRVLVAEISDNGRSPEGGIAVNGRAPEGEVAANGKVPEREIAVTGRVLDAEISDNARLPELEISANGRLPEGEIPVNGRSSEREVAVIGTTPEGETAVNGRVPKGEVADIGRVPEGDLVVATALAEGDTASQNGAQALGAETDAATESFLDRLASSLQAGPSNSEGPVNSGALLLRSVSGCAFVVTEAAAKRVEDLANEGESAGVGAGLFEAASSLVENIVDSAQAGGEVTGQIVSGFGEAVVESVSVAVEAVGSGVGEATDAVTETVSQLSEQVMEVVSSGVEEVTDSISETVASLGAQITDTVESAGESVSALVETVSDTVDTMTSSVAETVDNMTSSVAETMGDVGGAMVSLITEEEELGDTEFEAFRNQAGPQLRGRVGIDNLRVLSDGANLMQLVSDAYTFTLKLPPLQFSLVIAILPLLMSLVFTGVYLLDMQGLVPDDSVQTVYDGLQKGGHVAEAHWYALFQVFMFSLSLATGLQPVLAPVTPFSFLAANVNALLAQLLFVFLSGSVFARLSQRSRPIRCSTVALICPPCHENRSGKEWSNKVLMARYVLVGTRPSELVDVKVDLTFHYNTLTRNGSYFNRQVSLKLVRSEVAHQTGGMLVRHVIDESSPLYRRTEEMLKKEDAVFKLSVVGLERSSMQSVFELQYYCVADGDVIWDAEFEDVVLVNKSMQRVIDQSKVSRWKSVPTTGYRTINA